MKATTTEFMVGLLRRLQDLQTQLFNQRDNRKSLDINAKNERIGEEDVMVITATAFFNGKVGERSNNTDYEFVYGYFYSFWDEDRNEQQFLNLVSYLELDDNI